MADLSGFYSNHFLNRLIACSFDTKLTAKGKHEAKEAIKEAESLQPAPQLLLASPLSRALQTADITFKDFEGPRMAHSLARERTYFASDVGVSRSGILNYQWHEATTLTGCPVHSSGFSQLSRETLKPRIGLL